MSATTTMLPAHPERGGVEAESREGLALLIAWYEAEPERVGEVAFIPPGLDVVIGRGVGEADEARAVFQRQRPGTRVISEPFMAAGMSRRQLIVRVDGDRLAVEHVGRCPTLVDGEPFSSATLSPGDTLHVKDQLVLLCVQRPLLLDRLLDFPTASVGPFGEPDTIGLIGESPAAWHLRDRLAFAAGTSSHVLLLGESGSGKELAARTVHQLSSPQRHAFVARNAATLPDGLIDAELFGNLRNYPNPGMPERPGLVGQADGGTLFLDEIGEMPATMQAHLLRVLDSGGEYQRLGESTSRRSSLRVIAATNRITSDLKHDFAARLTIKVSIPSLNERIEDVPLLVRHLLRRAAQGNPQLFARFGDGAGKRGPRVQPELVEALLHHAYSTHVRELESRPWQAIAGSRGERVAFTDEVRAQLEAPSHPTHRAATEAGHAVAPPPAPHAPHVREPEAVEIRAAVVSCAGNLTRAARALGLPSRFALYRLLKKHGLDPKTLR